MADAPAPTASKGAAGFLTRKVGPFPVWLWAAAAVGIYYWYTHYGPGASSASSAAQAIDPATGVPYAEELQEAEDASASGGQIGPQGPAGPAGPGGPAGPPGGVTVPPTHPVPPPATGGQVTIPGNLVGESANFAIGELKSGQGLTASTSPYRDPSKEYVVTSVSPPAGTKVARGSHVVLGVRERTGGTSRWQAGKAA